MYPSTVKVKPIFSDDEKQKPHLLVALVSTDDEFDPQMEEALCWSLIDRGLTLVSSPCNHNVQRTPHEGTTAVPAVSLAGQPVAPGSPSRQEGAVVQATPMPKWAGPSMLARGGPGLAHL